MFNINLEEREFSEIQSSQQGYIRGYVKIVVNNIVKHILKAKANEPEHEISNNVVCATSKASDQPEHTRSLIRAFASHLSIL